jgi:hypothetical protein
MMPAEPLSPEEQSEVDTLKLLAARVGKRNMYSAPFGQALAALNGICARIFKSDPAETDAPVHAGEESW